MLYDNTQNMYDKHKNFFVNIYIFVLFIDVITKLYDTEFMRITFTYFKNNLRKYLLVI